MFFGPAGPDASTPQKTLQSFIAAINRQDRRAMAALVHGSKYNPALEPISGKSRNDPGVLSARDITVKPLSPTKATVGYLLQAQPLPPGKRQSNQETVDMMKVGDKWLIVTPALDPKSKVMVGYLTKLALLLVHPELIKLTPVMTKEEQARMNLKQIALGVLMYIEDYDGEIQLKPEDYPKVLAPYIRIANVFTSPLDKPGTISYLFNTNLAGRKASSIKDPKNTVLFYEGKPEALLFRYDGKALTAFIDGSARFVTPAEAKTLRWK